jgi:uncharacterized membrane protein
MVTPSETPDLESVNLRLAQLHDRLARIEAHLGIGPEKEGEAAPAAGAVETGTPDRDEALELQIGQNWFAKVGIVALAVGIAFLLTFPYRNLPPALPSGLGYLLVAGIVALSRFWRNSFQQISRYLLGGGLVLLYFTTLRLAYFSPQPVITTRMVEALLLLLVTGVVLVVAARRESPYLAAIALAMGFTAGLIGAEPYFVFLVNAAMAAVVAVCTVRYRWTSLLPVGIVLTYLSHFVWAVNNPVAGNAIQLVSFPEINLLFLLLDVVILSAANLVRPESHPEDAAAIVSAILNGLGSYVLFVIVSLPLATPAFVVWNCIASVVYLCLSAAFWVREKSRYATFVYAMLGYLALSAAIIRQFAMPEFFIVLCWQGILVVSTAVWYRSRFIVVANFVIYVTIFIAYLITAGSVSMVSLSFGIVALLSARILNWQKDRLELKTEMMRNAYLASALFIIPYALYHSVPAGYVSISWLFVALLYYLMSRYLSNRKYRWMALLTTALTIVYVIFVELVGVDPTIRIVSFLVLGTALLMISMVYSRRRLKGEPEKQNTVP